MPLYIYIYYIYSLWKHIHTQSTTPYLVDDVLNIIMKQLICQIDLKSTHKNGEWGIKAIGSISILEIWIPIEERRNRGQGEGGGCLPEY